jgi:hypothetical protein
MCCHGRGIETIYESIEELKITTNYGMKNGYFHTTSAVFRFSFIGLLK